MKRGPLPDADRLVVLFSDLLSKNPDPWAETDVDLSGAIQRALDGATPLFVVVDGDGLTPHYGRLTVTRGCARLVLWEGGGSVCDERSSPPGPSRCWLKPAIEPTALWRHIPRNPISKPNWRSASTRRQTPDHQTSRPCRKHRSRPSGPRHCSGLLGEMGVWWRPRSAGCVRVRSCAAHARIATLAEPRNPDGRFWAPTVELNSLQCHRVQEDGALAIALARTPASPGCVPRSTSAVSSAVASSRRRPEQYRVSTSARARSASSLALWRALPSGIGRAATQATNASMRGSTLRRS